MGWIREGLSEPGRGPAKHSSFIPTLTTQRENKENLVNVNTMAISVTKIQTNLAFCSPHARSCTHPSSLHTFLYPNSLSFFTFSTIFLCFFQPWTTCQPRKGNLPTPQCPPPQPPYLRQLRPSRSFTSPFGNSSAPSPPALLKFLHSLGDGYSFPLLVRTLITSISTPSS